MDKETSVNLKRVVIAFAIIMLPLTYLILVSIGFDKQEKAYIDACMHRGDTVLVNSSLKIMEKAMKIYPWHYMHWMNKSQVQTFLSDYRGALESAKRGAELRNNYAEGFEGVGYIYEYLEQPDSARLFYSKAINLYQERLENDSMDSFANTSIAILYCFINDFIKARLHIDQAMEYADDDMKVSIRWYSNYINHCQNGRYIDLFEFKTVKLHFNKSIDSLNIDSLCQVNGINYEGSSSSGDENTTYFFREIYKDKASEIGFIEP